VVESKDDQVMQPQNEPNRAQSTQWNARGGEVWVEQQAMLDRLFRPFELLLADTLQASRASEVLDIGCGAGATTIAAARLLAGRGRCVGVDLSVALVEAARRGADIAGVANAEFVAADAQAHPFDPGRFDAMISRFGVMFFADPVAAFANIRQAGRADAGLTFIAWRGAEENPFMTAAETAAAPLLPELAPRDPAAPGQFAFADPERVRRILTASGWRDVDVRPLDVACALPEADLDAYLTRMGPVGMLLPQLDAARRDRIVAAVRQAVDVYVSAGAAKFTAACWLVHARNPA
jgi:SAM-dependent methyltransferase